MENKKDKRKKILKISGLIGLFLLVFGLSYALFTVTLNGTKKVKVKTGKLELQLLDSNNNPIYITDQNNTTSYEINLDNQVPVDDETGLSTQAFEFKLKNTGNLKASYTIYLDDVALEEGESRLADEYVRYSLTKNGSEENPQGLSSRELDKGTIDTDNTTNTYTLKIWIAEDADNAAMDKVFSTTLRVEGTQYVAPPASEYGTKIAETELSETITATYYQPEDTGYKNASTVKRMSNVKQMDNEETYEGGTLVISGEGAIPNYTNDEENFSSILMLLADISTFDDFQVDEDYVPILKYNPVSLVIEEGITSIGDYSIQGIVSLKNIQLPTTLERIGESAFSSLSINEVNLPRGLKRIEKYAFETTYMSVIKVPGTIEFIDTGAFWATHNAVIYCETEETVDLVKSGGADSSKIIVDPTKFE